ncbi:hypothetical protein F4860DRAFT_499543 [Xylaria cubensis]|nr:hypothetical protein F4860DRAFT_499543 [Xylaria cubensis]
MYSAKVFLAIAALAGTSMSQKSDSQFCSSETSNFFSVLFAAAPTTPAAILSFVATATQEVPPLPTTIDPMAHQSQLCALATALPSSLLPEFASLASALLDFGKAHSSDFIDLVTNCAPDDEVASSTSYLDYIFTATGNICTEKATPTPGGASNGTYPTAYPTATPTITSHFNTSSTLIPTAAAARPTGALIGAAALGGVLGAAAML